MKHTIEFEALGSKNVRVIIDSAWEGELQFNKGNWVFFPDDLQAEPVSYETTNLKEAENNLSLEYETLLQELDKETAEEREAKQRVDKFLSSLEHPFD